MPRSLFAALVVVSLVSTPALAQPRSVLVLPWSTGETDPALLAARADATTDALASAGLTALALDDARERFEENGSSEPASLSEAELDQWLSLSRLAVRHLAHVDHAAALETLRQADALSRRALVALSREEPRARQVLDTCLYGVRAALETHDSHAAAQAMECRRLVPRLAPSPYNHTPEVVELLASVDRALAASAVALRIESAPSGCAVRLNGVALGTTPYVSVALAAGEYELQVECDAETRGRVHRVVIAGEASTIRIDARLESVLHTSPVLRLAYASRADADAQRLADAVHTASIVGAAEVWLLSVEGGDVVRIDRVLAGSSAPLASARTNGLAGLVSAALSLARGRSEDRTGSDATTLARWRGGADEPLGEEASTSPAEWGRAEWEVGLGVGVGVLALAGLAASLALADDGYRVGVGASGYVPLDRMYLVSWDAWQSQRIASWSIGLSAGALGVFAVGLAMEEEDGTPWWSWMLGGVGLAGAAMGAVLIGTSEECGNAVARQACVEAGRRFDLGVSVVSLSMPFIAVPLVFLLRDVVDGGVLPSVEITGQSAMLQVAGAW